MHFWREMRHWRNLVRKRLYVSGRAEQQIVADFHRLYYQLGKECQTAWAETYWRGRRVIQCPMDLMVYQKIIQDTKPHFIVETGTNEGGLALFLMDVSTAKIITVDRRQAAYLEAWRERIRCLIGGSIETYPCVEELVRPIRFPWPMSPSSQRTMVILDSDHRAEHVRKELVLYSQLVSAGCYLIVCDTHFGGHPIAPDFGPGPYEAVQEFVRDHAEFRVDHARESQVLTFNPGGFLIRES